MAIETTNTLIVGGGQAGLAMSEHLSAQGIPHIVLERHRIAERWRTERWDSLVANGPAWHDRFPSRAFDDLPGDDFAGKERIAQYFEDFAAQINAPIRCDVEVKQVRPAPGGGFDVQTSQGAFHTQNVVAATGPFQRPVIPPIVPELAGVAQMHSTAYRAPEKLAPGAVLVVGAGSSGAQIAQELRRAGRKVFLSVGPHERPPRRYRGKDFVWWLGVLGKWDLKTPPEGREHVTIAVSGAQGGETVEFRRFAERGITLLGMTQGFENGTLTIAPDLADNLAAGDRYYWDLLDECDAYAAAQGLNLPIEPGARDIAPDPACVSDPIRQLNLAEHGITTIIWATGFALDYSWLQVDTFDAKTGRPIHQNGVSQVPGVYFLGLPWLSMRGSSFIWGVWKDAQRLAAHIADQNAEIEPA